MRLILNAVLNSCQCEPYFSRYRFSPLRTWCHPYALGVTLTHCVTLTHLVTLGVRSYQAPLGLAAAVSTCVGNALGSGNGQAAKRAAAVGIACAFVLQAMIALGVVFLAAKPLVRASGLMIFLIAYNIRMKE